MSDREFAIKTSLSIDDLRDGLRELLNLFSDVPKDVETRIDIEADKSIIQDVKEDLEELQDFEANPVIDADDEASAVIDAIKTELEVIDESTVEANISAEDDASSIVDAISSKLDELEGITTVVLTAEDDASDIIDQVKSELDDLPTDVNIEINADSSDMDGVAEATYTASDAATTLGSAGLDAWLYKMATGAGDFEDSWLRLRNAVKEGDRDMPSVMAEWQGSIDTMTSSTKRGAGDARTYITELGRAGVTNKDLLVDLFDGVSEGAFFAKEDVGTFSNQMRQMISSETPRMMTLNRTWGVTTETIEKSYGSVEEFKKKWKEATPEVRAQMLDVLLHQQYLSDGVKDYGDSWEHSIDQAGRSIEYLTRSLGGPLLDASKNTLKTFSDTLNGITNEFRKLPGDAQLFVSSLIAIGAGIGTIYGITTTGGKILDSLGITDNALKTVKGWWGNLYTTFKDGVSRAGSTVKNLISDITRSTGGKNNVYDMVFDEDTGRWEAEESRVKGFIERIKGKVDELKSSKFKLSDIFGGEDTKPLDTVKTKIETTIGDIKGKWDSLKGKLNIKDWFGDEKGTINTQFIDDFIKGASEKLPSLEKVGERIPGSVMEGAGRILPKLISRLAGDGPLIALTLIQTLDTSLKTEGEKTLKDTFKTLLGNVFGAETYKAILDAVGLGGVADQLWETLLKPHKKAAELIGLDKLGHITINQIFEAIFGKETVKNTEEWWEQNIYLPFHKHVELLKKDPVKYLFGDLKPINLWDIILPKTAAGAGGGGGEDPLVKWDRETKEKIKGFFGWLGGQKFPNILDIILPKPAAAAGGEGGGEDPLVKWDRETREKINGFFGWLGTLNPISIIDILMGKKPGEKGGGNEGEDPLVKWDRETKEKINKFFEWLGTLNPFSIIDLILGRKPGEKEQEDPLVKWDRETKERINKFFEWLGTLNPFSIVDLILGRKPGEKEQEDPLVKWDRETKERINKFFEWLGSLNPFSLVDKILGRKPGEEDPLVKWIRETIDRVNKFIEDLQTTAQKWYDTGKQLIDNFVKGLQDGYNNLPPVLKKMADALFSSPAKEGPLSGVKEENWLDYGRALVRAFASGMYQEMYNTLFPVLDEMNWMNRTFGNSPGWGTFDLTGGKNTEYNRPLTLPGPMGSEWSSWNPLNIDWTKPMAEAIDFTQGFANLFPASPPKTGALSYVTPRSASSWMEGVVGGMADGAAKGIGTLNTVLSSAGVGALSSSGGLSGSGASSIASAMAGYGGATGVLRTAGDNLEDSSKALSESANTLKNASKSLLETAGHGGARGILEHVESSGSGVLRTAGDNINVTVQPGAVVIGDAASRGPKSKLMTAGRGNNTPGAAIGQAIDDELDRSLKNRGINVVRW